MNSSNPLYLGETFDLAKYEEIERMFLEEDYLRFEGPFPLLRRHRLRFALKKLLKKTKELFSCFNTNTNTANDNVSTPNSHVSQVQEQIDDGIQDVPTESVQDRLGEKNCITMDNKKWYSDTEQHPNKEIEKTTPEELDSSVESSDLYNENLPKRFFSKDPKQKEVPVVQPGIVKKLSPRIGKLFGSSCSYDDLGEKGIVVQEVGQSVEAKLAQQLS